jgi:hypothetical protein
MAFAQGSPQLPPMGKVAGVLRTVTERLAAELASPQAQPPEWSEFEWRTARAVAAMHGISGLLAAKLTWRGPEGWEEFLSRQREHIARRQVRMHELLAAVGERFQCAGVPVQALKGAALHLKGLYGPGQRAMADLDLLTSPQHTERATDILATFGLHESHRTFKHRIFEPRDTSRSGSFGEHTDNAMKVELHERICEPLPHRLTDISMLISPAHAVPGLNPYPSRAALMAHLLLHAGGGMAHRWLRLIQLNDVALLAQHFAPQDWEQLLSWRPWWAWPALMLTEKYYGAAAPVAVMVALRTSCPPVLRHACHRQCLSDVSLSRLWFEALPGIEWARTAGEVVAFMARRIVPSKEIRSDREFALATDPSLAHGDWGDLSQVRTILRMLRTRMPRPWPLYNLREALAEPR